MIPNMFNNPYQQQIGNIQNMGGFLAPINNVNLVYGNQI
jgi:hypothetical protein